MLWACRQRGLHCFPQPFRVGDGAMLPAGTRELFLGKALVVTHTTALLLTDTFHWELLHPLVLHLPPNSFLQFLSWEGSVW